MLSFVQLEVVLNENGKEMLYNSYGSDTGNFFALSSKHYWEYLKIKFNVLFLSIFKILKP